MFFIIGIAEEKGDEKMGTFQIDLVEIFSVLVKCMFSSCHVVSPVREDDTLVIRSGLNNDRAP